MERWAAIVRVSHMGGRKKGADNFHADSEQIADCEAYAAAHDAQLEILEPELDVSGGLPLEERPSLRAAIEGVEAGRYTGIVVAYLSRLTRSRSGQEIWDRVEAAGGHVHCARENIDTSTPNGRFIRDIHLANAVREREEHADRFAARKRGAVTAGIWMPRVVPLGYDRDPATRKLVPNDRASLVREAFKLKAANTPNVQIADRLGMTPSGTRAVLRNRVYLGEVRVGDFVNQSAHQPLVDEQTWEAAQDWAPRGPRFFDEIALLAGLVRCASCGYRMNRARKSGVIYTCSVRNTTGRCPAPVSITCARVDEYVEQVVLAHLDQLSIEEEASTEAIEDLRADLDLARRELAAFLEGVDAAGLPKAAFAEGATRRQAAIEDAEHALNVVLRRQSAIGHVGNLRDAWPDWTIKERNHLLRGLLDYVVVGPVGRGRAIPAAERVQILKAGCGLDFTGGARPVPFLHPDDKAAAGILGGKNFLSGTST